MDIVKDIFEAIGTRIRSHFFGSIAISFIVINWKPLFYLVSADTTVPAKFIYFDGTTTLDTLLWLPLLYGIAIALVTPWVAFVGTLWAAFPTKFIKDVQASTASATISRKYELEIKRNSKKLEVIASAKAVEEEFETLSDPEEKERIREEFSKQENESDAIGESSKIVDLVSGLPVTAQSLLLNTPRRSERLIKINNTNKENAEYQRLVQTGLHNFIVNSQESVNDLQISIERLLNRDLIVEQNVSDQPHKLYRVTGLGIEVGEYLFDLGGHPVSNDENMAAAMPSHLVSGDQLSSPPVLNPQI